MGAESPKPASTPMGAVFLSYASQDADAARRICDALRASGIEVWFDQSELRGGDAWDQKIRDQIHDCRLFVPIISANTERRDEGYFRREWSLAVDRTRDIAHKRTFLVPVVIDGTPERAASVPDKFHELQWTRLPGGETAPAFVARIRRLLTPEAPPSPSAAGAAGPKSGPPASVPVGQTPLSKVAIWGASAIAAIACVYFVADRFWLSKDSISLAPARPPSAQQSAAPVGTASDFHPPPHSIAVLPFVNMSGDKDQEYFSDGLSEELLNDLSRINELQVAARTSAFSFKGKDTDIGTIARKLNVGAVLEGSVRRSAHRVRVTAQLINATTGFHIWSETYDRNLGDVLKMQSEIANGVASALKITLLGDVAAKAELGGTRNPAAFDAYLRAAKTFSETEDDRGVVAAMAGYSEAIRLDPDYAMAYADRSLARADHARRNTGDSAFRDYIEGAKADAQEAIARAPGLAEGHLALANVAETALEFAHADQEYQRALALEPGNARLLSFYGLFAIQMGRTEAGLDALRRSATLDPLNYNRLYALGTALVMTRRFDAAVATIEEAKTLAPAASVNTLNLWIGYAYYGAGDFERARVACESVPGGSQYFCLAGIYRKLGRRADAEIMLAKLRASVGEIPAAGSAMIFGQWGDIPRALDSLETAMKQRDPDLELVKTGWIFDPLRGEPRFQAVEKALKFPTK